MTRRAARRGQRTTALQLSRILPILGALGLLLAAAIAWAAWPGSAGPGVPVDPAAPGRLVAAQAAVDLGRVPLDKQVEARFELANTGGVPVKLVDRPLVKTLEGCCPTNPAVSSTVIKPGDKLVLRYPYMMHAGMGGPHRFEITLRTDSPETPVVTLTLTAVSG